MFTTIDLVTKMVTEPRKAITSFIHIMIVIVIAYFAWIKSKTISVKPPIKKLTSKVCLHKAKRNDSLHIEPHF